MRFHACDNKGVPPGVNKDMLHGTLGGDKPCCFSVMVFIQGGCRHGIGDTCSVPPWGRFIRSCLIILDVSTRLMIYCWCNIYYSVFVTKIVLHSFDLLHAYACIFCGKERVYT